MDLLVDLIFLTAAAIGSAVARALRGRGRGRRRLTLATLRGSESAEFPIGAMPAAMSLLDQTAEGAGSVGLSIHDASRLGWSATIALPEHRAAEYQLEVELEGPANAFAPHSHWNHFQSLSRLDSPSDAHGCDVTIDSLRCVVVAACAKLSRARDGFARHCRTTWSVAGALSPDEAQKTLWLWIEVALRTVSDARQQLLQPSPGVEPDHVMRERLLADDYLGIQLLTLLADAGHALKEARQSLAAPGDALAAVLDAVEANAVSAVEGEVSYRRTRQFLCVDVTSAGSLRSYLDRASRLKKHFDDMLYLDTEAFQTSDRALHGISAVAGMAAASVAFLLQFKLLQRAQSTPSAVGSGLAVLALIAAVAYTVRDRFKDVGRDWLAGKLHVLYGQRVARYRVPARVLAARPVVGRARESFVQTNASRPNSLNPQSGAAAALTTLRFIHKGTVFARSNAVVHGVRQIKHVFRYDLSPLFSRLHDSVKSVAVVDADNRRLSFMDAPRSYRLRLRATLTRAGCICQEAATLVVSKRGLERLEPVSE